MKFSKLALMPLLALALVACGPTTSSEAPAPATSTLPEPTETVPATSETPAPTEWTAEEEALMKSKLNDNVLPFVYVEGAMWDTLDLEDGSDPYLVYVKMGATHADLDYYCTELLKLDTWGDLTEQAHGNAQTRVLLGMLANYEWNECVIVTAMYDAKNQMFIALYDYDIDVRTWDANFVNANIEAIYGVAVPLPAPEFEFLDIDIYLDNQDLLNIDLYAESDQSASYEATLAAANWVKQGETPVYHDPTGSISCTVTWYPEYECVTLLISPLNVPEV